MDEAQTDDAVFDGFNVLEIYNASSYGAWMAGLNLDEQYLENINGTIYKVLKDALGSTVGLTNPSQGLTDTYRYDPYGTPTHTYGGSLNGALFAGQDWDFNNLYYMRARYYMPSIARFLSRDPAGGGVNPYLYAGDDPVDLSDPTGLDLDSTLEGPGDVCGACLPHPIGAYIPQPTLVNQGGIDRDVFAFYAGNQNGAGLGDPVISVQADEDEEDEGNPLTPEGWAEKYIRESRSRFLAQRIASGHAFKHVPEFPGISTRAQFAAEINRILTSPTATKALSGGREAFWDALTGTVVIYDPNNPDLGTAFKPSAGRQYFNRLR